MLTILCPFYFGFRVRKVRNQLFHSHNFQVTDDELTTYIAAMVALLQDSTTLLDEPSAQVAVDELMLVNNVTCSSTFVLLTHLLSAG